ncbi:MAG: tRNA uridine-5-carboxymethylaminomethyl(34) synthesis GTPase MnmE [Desulfobacterota bacterium]|nr:tRNA uridine-5-carboxymethylaminomethyl(34) synthesis GTPase MnmE [Thermodesulfobacteriota bacterium]
MVPPDTIAALSTPSGEGGIGIIRLSGPRALAIARLLFVPRPRSAPLESHRLVLGELHDPRSREVLDEVLLTYMQAPRTYTREDVVEINCHSGPLVLKKIIEILIREGARLADPGEFTLRAFLNGRIDLTRAEGVIDLIQARSDQALTQAARLLQGELFEKIGILQEALLALLAQLETAIDFPEEELEIIDPAAWIRALEDQALGLLDDLIRAYEEGRPYREGVSLVIVGKPNVGKSSLLNRLLREERALVTPVPGTTRDTIEETLLIRGIPFRLIDTAGLHSSPDEVEQAGMARTRSKIADAQLLLFLIDRSQPVDDRDLGLYEEIKDRPHWVLLNKTDLPAALVEKDLGAFFPETIRLSLSARTGEGLDTLRERIGAWFLRDHPRETVPALVPNLRQKTIMEKARAALLEAREEMKRNVSPELIAVNLQQALEQLGVLVGRTTPEDVLEEIFSRFCIGK